MSSGVGMAPIPSIHESINGSEPARDASASRTAARVEDDAPPPPLAEPSSPSRIRRAPWSPPTTRRERSSAPESQPEKPQDGRAPAPRSPTSPLTATGPADLMPALPQVPAIISLAGDPSLGANPDAVPEVEQLAEGPVPDPVPAIPAVADLIVTETPVAPTAPPARDPSLGPEPDAVPPLDIPTPTPVTPGAAPEIPTSLPDPVPVASPVVEPSPGPKPDAVPLLNLPPVPDSPQAQPEPSTPLEPPPGMPVLAPTPRTADPSQSGAPVAAPPVELPSTAQQAPKFDPNLVRTAAPADTTNPLETRIAPGKAASETAARIGDEIITLNELRLAVREQVRGMSLPKDQNLSSQELNSIAGMMLDRMIDRAILMQEARRKFKDEKRWKSFIDAVERVWKEKELPDLMQQYSVRDEVSLREKLESQGLSLSDKHGAFVQNTMAREFLVMQVREKIRVFPAEMREYYEAHKTDFDRPAQVRWREVAIDVAKHRDRIEARRKAELALGRLRRGEAFDRVAMSESEGPTAVKGGLWETAPDSYSVPAVSVALYRQPLQQISGILEGPDSYHIVLIESRRQAGPARFDEVQDEIRKLLNERKEGQEMNTFLEDLRSRYIVTTMFDGTESAPGQSRRRR